MIRPSYFDESLIEEERSDIPLINLAVRIEADWQNLEHGYNDNPELSYTALDMPDHLHEESRGWFGEPGEQIDASTIADQPFPALHHIALQIFQHFPTMGSTVFEFGFRRPAEKLDCRSIWRTYTYWTAGTQGRNKFITWTCRAPARESIYPR